MLSLVRLPLTKYATRPVHRSYVAVGPQVFFW